MVLDGPEELELALRLFRDDSLMAKREARRKKYFVAPSARRKIKSMAARKRAARARLKRSAILPGHIPLRKWSTPAAGPPAPQL